MAYQFVLVFLGSLSILGVIAGYGSIVVRQVHFAGESRLPDYILIGLSVSLLTCSVVEFVSLRLYQRIFRSKSSRAEPGATDNLDGA